MKYANVIVDRSLQNLDRVFVYKIPEDLKEKLVVGATVIVPFGKGDTKISGFVVELTDKAEFDEKRIKEIFSLEDNTIIESKLIVLAKYIRDNFGGTMNDALKTVTLVKKMVKNREDVKIFLTDNQEKTDIMLEKLNKAETKISKERLAFLEILIKEKVTTRLLIKKKYGIDVPKAIIDYFAKEEICTTKKKVVYRNPVREEGLASVKKQLNERQQLIADSILSDFKKNIRRNYLLHGVTGSGKTEIYMEIIDEVIRQNKQIIMLIPEIALTYQTVRRFYERFGNRISVINSSLSDGEKSDQYKRAKSGEVDIMIGPRSALFTPFERLGLIIVDEEHEKSYKSDSVPKYNAIDVAIERGRLEDASVILGSATPSLASYLKAVNGEYKLYTLDKKANNSKPANVEIVDLKEELKSGNKSIISRRLKQLMLEKLEKKEQIMLFINRRGFSGFVSCRSCGQVIKCPHCDISLTYHAPEGQKGKYTSKGTMECHYCGYKEMATDLCKECGSPFISTFGTGTQKLEYLIKKEFPMAKTLRMDADTTKNKGNHEKILKAFNEGEADILIGTQMIVKGHDFLNVTLMGIIAADLSLNEGNYMSGEDTFDLLLQACGRPGRGEKSGDVIIQTYSPDNYSIIAAANNDYKTFFDKELSFRKAMKYPPVSNLLVVLFLSKEENACKDFANTVARSMNKYIKEMEGTCENTKKTSIIGPVAAQVAKIDDIYRNVIYIKNPNYQELVKLRKKIEDYHEKYIKKGYYKNVIIHFDFNPKKSY